MNTCPAMFVKNWPQQKPLWQTMLNIKSMWIT